MNDVEGQNSLAALTAEIVTAYLTNHRLAAEEVAQLVTLVGRELGSVGQAPAEPARPEPAVPVRRSVQRDHLVCLACGQKLKSLRRHLQVSHGLTPEAYRQMFGLRADYPMVAPASSEQRAEIARRTGLGRRPQPAPEPAAKPAAKPRGRRAAASPAAEASAPAAAPRRGRPPKAAAAQAEPTATPRRAPRAKAPAGEG